MRGDSSKCGDPGEAKMRGLGVGAPNAGIGGGLQMRGSGEGSKCGDQRGVQMGGSKWGLQMGLANISF